MKKKLLSLLVLLVAAVSGAWADETYTVKIEANGNTVIKENVTLPYTFACNYQTENGELDQIIKQLYNLSEGYNKTNSPTADGNDNVTAGMNGYSHTFTISAPFEGVATVSGKYWNGDSGNDLNYVLTISIPGYVAPPAGDYLFTVAPCEHGSGKVTFTVQDKDDAEKITENAKGANEGDKVTMTITPDEGWIVDATSVKAESYTTWDAAGARRRSGAPANITILGDVTLTKSTTAENTWTFTMPAASVLVSAAYIPVAAFAPAEPSGTLAPTAAEGVIAGEDKAIIVAGTVANIPETTNPQGTVKYFVTDNKDMTAEQAAKANGWVETLPTAAGYTGSYADDFQVYVWYYIQAATGYADSEPQRIEVTVLSNLFDLTFKAANANTIESGNATVTVGGTAATVTEGKLEGVKMGSEVKMTAKEGYKFRKVEVKKKAAGKPVSEITPDDIFKVIASDGIIYDNIAAAESAGTVAQGLIVYVGSNTENENYNHGLALALNDENSNTQGEAINACNAKNTSTPIVDALWMLPSKDQWNTMFNAAGGDWKLRDCFSSAGGNNMVKDGEYWSSTGDSEWVWYFMFTGYDWEGTWGDIQPYYNYSCNVRACIVF